LISGISRSGTSYLCSLLDRYDNCVGINEPKEIIHMLAESRVAWKLPFYYRDVRTLILDRKPIRNKVHEGRVIENTAEVNKSTSYRAKVRFDDFVLAPWQRNWVSGKSSLSAQSALKNSPFTFAI
jgi:hypothetical protein